MGHVYNVSQCADLPRHHSWKFWYKQFPSFLNLTWPNDLIDINLITLSCLSIVLSLIFIFPVKRYLWNMLKSQWGYKVWKSNKRAMRSHRSHPLITLLWMTCWKVEMYLKYLQDIHLYFNFQCNTEIKYKYKSSSIKTCKPVSAGISKICHIFFIALK